MRRTLLPLVFVAALLCAGCSDGSGPAKAEATVKPAAAPSPKTDHAAAIRAAVAATQKSSARIDEEITMGDGTNTFVISVKGDFDWAGNRGRLGVGLSSPDDPGKKPVRMDEIFHGGTVYMGGLPDMNGSWMSIRQDRAEAHYLLRAPANDPRHVLEQVAQMRGVSSLGLTMVKGEVTTHYRGTLSWETVTLRMTKDMRAKVDGMPEEIAGIPVRADVWVDESGRVLRTEFEWLTGFPGAARATMTLTDHGKAVRVSAPPAGDVVPTPALGGPLTG
ncbi:LolA-like protein [Streptomyces sp. OR43]|uniref:hypothetical protein n=1 Tax=Streptomyces sp. or43 TaxID=2478957 RepID=UPI0011CE6294|nr:hypothetical protein [Streptomyces sp. or43]TXS35884.1 hypothetical protein EAO72_20010 [Streptomyces sp. or43]